MKSTLAEQLELALFNPQKHFSLNDEFNVLQSQPCCDKINHYIKWLQQFGVNSVMIASPPSIDALCLCYALVLSNKTYIPVHSSTSATLVASYLENYQIDLLLVHPQLANLFEGELKNKLANDTSKGFYFYRPERQEPQFCLLPGILFFTSGTCDQPKAVYYRYDTLSRYLTWCLTEFQLSQQDNFLFTTELSFVASLRPLFVPALAGANLQFLAQGSNNKLQLIIDALNKEQITILNLTPSLFKLLLQHLEKSSQLATLATIRLVILSGEPLDISNINYWFTQIKTDTIFYSLYGATEYLVPFYKKITGHMEEKERLHLGQLRAGSEYRLMFDQTRGYELFVAGDISTAYFDSSLTQNSYLIIEGCRFIKTNDFVDQQGNELYFCFRGQRCFKKYGQLVNLDQIEYILKKHYKNINFVVLEAANLIYLIIHGGPPDEALSQQINDLLKAQLPCYMHPDETIFKENLPLTVSSKIDYRAIKSELSLNRCTEFSEYFKRFFKNSEINFNTRIIDLGLESIDYIEMAEALLEITGKWLDVSKIRDDTRIASIDSCLVTEDFEKQEFNQTVKLNPIQSAAYYNELYNNPEFWLCLVASYALKGTIDLKRLEKAIIDTLSNHFMLSSKLEQSANEFIFVSVPLQSEFTLSTPIFFSQPNSERLRTSIYADRLMRIYIQKKRKQYFLVLAYHHIAVDGWSAMLVREEIFRRYEGLSIKNQLDRADEIVYLNQANQAWLSTPYNINEFQTKLSTINPYEYNHLAPIFSGKQDKKHLTLILKKEEVEHFAAKNQIDKFPFSVIFVFALHQIIRKHSGIKKQIFYTSCSNRHLPVPHIKDLITNLATGLPLFLDNTDLTPKEFASQIQENLTINFRNMSYGALSEIWRNQIISPQFLSSKKQPYSIIFTYINKIVDNDYIQSKYIDWENSITYSQRKSKKRICLRVYNMGSHFVVLLDCMMNKDIAELIIQDWAEIKNQC